MHVHPLVKFDNFCDYAPLVSTVTNLTDLFLKTVVVSFLSASYVAKSHYFTHLSQKSYFRCATLLLPLLGNAVVMLYDCYKSRIAQQATNSHHLFNTTGKRDRQTPTGYIDDPEKALRVLSEGGNMEQISSKLKADRDFIKMIIKHDSKYMAHAAAELKGDKDFVLEILRLQGYVIYFVDEHLQQDKDVIKEAVIDCPSAFSLAGPKIRADREFLKALLPLNSMVLKYIDPALKNDPEIVGIALDYTPTSFSLAGKQLRADKQFLLQRLKSGTPGMILHGCPSVVAEDGDFFKEAVKYDSFAFKYASDELKKNKAYTDELKKQCPAIKRFL